MKRLLALVLCLVTCLVTFLCASSFDVLGQRNLTTKEKGIFALLRSPVEVSDGRYRLPEEAVQTGENYLSSLETPLTDIQIFAIMDYASKAINVISTSGTGDLTKWPEGSKNSFLENIDGIAQQLGLRARRTNNGAIEIYEPGTGTVITRQDRLVLMGDVNDDGKVNKGDLTLLLQYFAAFDFSEMKPSVEIGPGADVNGDGKIDTADLIRLVNQLKISGSELPFIGF